MLLKRWITGVRFFLSLLTLLSAWPVLSCIPLSALEQPPVSTALAVFQERGQLQLQLQFSPRPGWHLYGQNPGPNGTPPDIKLELPDSVTAAPWQWPRPKQLESLGEKYAGYDQTFTLRSALTLKSRTPVTITANVSWVACKVACVPGRATLVLRIDPGTVPNLPEPRTRSLPAITGLAFLSALLGGLILNLMPCVFPVLSLKVLHLVKEAQASNTRPIRHGIAYAMGVLISVWSLAGVLLILQRQGAVLGWGFQLQNPGLVLSLIFLFTLIALNLFGVFEWGLSLTRTGQSISRFSGLPSSFFTGVLAVVVASPCTAPFMGTALGIALTQPVLINLFIFTGLGLGFAAPYVALTAKPEGLRWLPKPGLWMERFRQLLGFPMLITVVWLIRVYKEISLTPQLEILILQLIGLGFGSWLYGMSRSRWRQLGIAGCLLVFWGWCVWTIDTDRTRAQPLDNAAVSQPGTATTSLEWEPFNPAQLQTYINAKTPAFVDFTARWCLTCQVNDRLLFHNPAVVQFLKSRGIRTIKADWTTQPPEMTALMQDYERNSVPVYLFYSGKSESKPPRAKVLPELMTPSKFIELLKNDLK